MHLQPLPAFEDNYIWLLRDDGGRALIVDPGEAGPVLAALADAPAPHAILLTHHHGDHVGGVAELLERWPGLPVIAPHDTRIATANRRVGDGDMVEIGPWRFEVLGIPGHTLSHIAFCSRNAGGEGLLFCGDTLFSLGCGRMFEGDAAQMHASLEALAALPGNTRVCCAHEYTLSNLKFARAVEPGNAALLKYQQDCIKLRDADQPTLPSSIATELAVNPFLRTRESEVAQSAKKFDASTNPSDATSVLTALREWKNNFR